MTRKSFIICCVLPYLAYMVLIVALSGCASPYNAGVCTVNDRLQGEC